MQINLETVLSSTKYYHSKTQTPHFAKLKGTTNNPPTGTIEGIYQLKVEILNQIKSPHPTKHLKHYPTVQKE